MEARRVVVILTMMSRALTAALSLLAALDGARAWAYEAGITPLVSATIEASHLIEGGPGSLYSLYVTTTAAAGYLMTFNTTSVPPDGPVTPVECVVVPANSTVSISFGGPPDIYSRGIVAVFSSTGCFNKTASPTAFFKARVQ
ncbi:MAG TPA: hypothetical protein VMS01_08350 [Stellaceae bacterium]|nr:hypothetical protein [Stellaceae bacterium]